MMKAVDRFFTQRISTPWHEPAKVKCYHDDGGGLADGAEQF
jgi:hypothetical protein